MLLREPSNPSYLPETQEAENTVSELMSRGVGAGVSKTRTRGAYLAAVDLQMRLQQLRSSHDQVSTAVHMIPIFLLSI